MKTIQKAWFGLVGVAFAMGCIPSIHPIYTEQDVVQRDEIVGRWIDKDGTETWHFHQADEGSYQLVLVDQQGRDAIFSVHLTEIGGALFMDLFPVRADETNPGFYEHHLVSVHTFLRVSLTDQAMGLSFLHPEWLKRNRAELGTTLPYVQHDKNSLLLTGDTATLRKFLAEHLEAEGAFSEPWLLSRVKDR